ncbi:hypothetical protein Tco_0980784, partial [Tanacetum coccineum]
SIKKNPEKRGNGGEPSKDRNVRDDNKMTRTGNAFATTTNPVRRENTGTVPKCTTCNTHHLPGAPCRSCFNYNHPGHFAKDCRVVPRNAQRPGVNHQNQVVAINGGQGRGNQGNQARGRALMLGAEEARQDPNIMTSINEMIELRNDGALCSPGSNIGSLKRELSRDCTIMSSRLPCLHGTKDSRNGNGGSDSNGLV